MSIADLTEDAIIKLSRNDLDVTVDCTDVLQVVGGPKESGSERLNCVLSDGAWYGTATFWRGGIQKRPITHIATIALYNSNWTIKARVVTKSAIRTWSNNRGSGSLFNVTFLDSTGEIRATGFNQAVDRLYDVLQVGRVFFVTKARVELAKRKFSNVNNDYELHLEQNTSIEPCLDDADVPVIKFDFVKIDQLLTTEKDSSCDVIGVVVDCSEVSEIATKSTNRAAKKRELTIADDSGYSVRVTLWGETAEKYSEAGYPVIAFKGVKVGDFGGRSLTMLTSSLMYVNLDHADTAELRDWFDNTGKHRDFTAHTSSTSSSHYSFDHGDQRDLSQIRDATRGMSETTSNYSVRAMIMDIKAKPLAYPACRSPGCSKKVVEISDGRWLCEKCNTSHSSPDYRYTLHILIGDATGTMLFQAFDDVGKVILGMSANAVIAMREANNYQGTDNALSRATKRTWNFVCRTRNEAYDGEPRLRYEITRAEPIDFLEEAQELKKYVQSDWAA
ncbi:replication factor-a protein [Schizophyllum commune H4-8]|nr:replication factor-a protein [Schizophyllum commune H4-8]KAI5895965.1 replication factor-a protein [Schizophyllum commune H4-8]